MDVRLGVRGGLDFEDKIGDAPGVTVGEADSRQPRGGNKRDIRGKPRRLTSREREARSGDEHLAEIVLKHKPADVNDGATTDRPVMLARSFDLAQHAANQ